MPGAVRNLAVIGAGVGLGTAALVAGPVVNARIPHSHADAALFGARHPKLTAFASAGVGLSLAGSIALVGQGADGLARTCSNRFIHGVGASFGASAGVAAALFGVVALLSAATVPDQIRNGLAR
jgi:hypothetical protein